MGKLIRNAYPLENKKNQDLLHATNLGLLAFWKLHYGDAIPISPNECFKFFPNNQNKVPQYKRELFIQKNHEYFVSIEVSCKKRVSGKIGIGLGGSNNSLTVNKETEGFVSIQRVVKFNTTGIVPIFLGGMNQANLIGEIRNVLMLDLKDVLE